MSIDKNPSEQLFSFCQLFIENILFSFQETFRPKLSTLQLRILMCIKEHGPQTMSELAQRLRIPRQQSTQIVDRLYEMNLVQRQRDDRDRRIIRIVWSDSGKAQFSNEVNKYFDELYSRISSLPQEDCDEFMSSAASISRLLPAIGIDNASERMTAKK